MWFISEDELALHATDGRYVAEKAEAYIRGLLGEVETAKAAADASSITAEQTCSMLEHKFLSLSSEFQDLQSRNSQLQSSLDLRVSELADIRSQKHQLHLLSIGKDGEIERLTTELSELNNSKRQLMELLARKDSEISEKNASINSYLDRIVKLTDTGAQREARLSELEVQLSRSQAACARLTQEKELVERHNVWLNEELTAKVDSFLDLRRIHAEMQEDMSVKLSDADRRFNECTNSLKWHKERVKELESKLTSLQEELSLSKDAAASIEERYTAELSTVNKLAQLYKESSEEWSHKAGELEGVIRALETRMGQVESDYKDKIEKEVSCRKELEKEALALREKLEMREAELENGRKENELNLLPVVSFTGERHVETFNADRTVESGMIVPKIPVGVSGTALAASLLRDGWSLVKMYTMYQEAVDALRHEQLGRKESEAVLQRVLCELEEKAGVIVDERAEYERMIDSYSMLNLKLQQSFDEKASLEKTIQELKVNVRRHEREYNLAQKEIVDLQKQVTVLLKECRDIQLRCGNTGIDHGIEITSIATAEMDSAESDSDKVISENLLTFRDINGLVEQNVQLRSLVRNLSEHIENNERDYKERLEMELRKHAEEAETKVAAVLSRAEEQGRMIESLHSSVAMYKRLYEEEHNLRSSFTHPPNPSQDNGRKDMLLMLEGSQEASKKVQEKAAERVRSLEEDLELARGDIISVRSERDKFALDAKFARERLDDFLKEYEHQRHEMNGILARNVELSHLVVEYQRKVRESSESLNSSEELLRKLKMEISVLKHEKEMLSNAEKRASDEVRNLSERVYRLQASLDTIQSAEEVREEARAAERRKQEEYTKHFESEWASAKKELQRERDTVRSLTSDREQSLKRAMTQVEEMSKELANALHAVTAAESRASAAETKLSDFEKKIKVSNVKMASGEDANMRSSFSTTEVVTDLLMAKEEIEKLKEEARANKEHMLQYKSIAQVNESALKQMEIAHETFKIESERLKESLEAESKSLRNKISELERELTSRSEEVAVAATGKEETLTAALAEVSCLKEETSNKSSQIMLLETQIDAMRQNLEEEHGRRRTAQNNYERQVILQSETIQELTRTSQALGLLQQEASDLRNLMDALKCENSELKAKWDEEKSVLEIAKTEAVKKYDELNEQNKILHNRLEALHIQLAEKERGSAAFSPESGSSDSHDNTGLQNVVNYLRRSKEIAETEMSLLKQEKFRLQSQLESALKAAENSQGLLRAERESSRAKLLSEDEFKSLQIQVREMNLLRESNIQLREENKHNFEECQKLREIAQKAQSDSSRFETLLREKEVEVEACKKEAEMESMKKADLEKRLSDLLERSRGIDVEDYDRIKHDLLEMQEKIKEREAKMQEIQIVSAKLQDTISLLEQDLARSKAELVQKDRRIHEILQTEARLKIDLDRHRKQLVQMKRKCDALSKEKDEISEEKQALCKQIEDLKQVRRPVGNTGGEQVLKEKDEKDHRIQILERTVERLREELKKEGAMRQLILESLKDLSQVRSKIEQQKLALEGLSAELSEGNVPENFLGSCRAILDDFNIHLLSWVENVGNAFGVGTNSSDSTADAAAAVAPAGQATTTPAVVPTMPAKSTEEKDARAKINVETRKTGRRLVRPKLAQPEEPHGDVEMLDSEGTGKKSTPPHEPEMQQPSASASSLLARKRLSSSEQTVNEGESCLEAGAPLLKKAKGSDLQQEGAEEPTSTNPETTLNLPAVEEPRDTEDESARSCKDEAGAEKEEAEITGEKSDVPDDHDEFKASAPEDPDAITSDQTTADNQQVGGGSDSEKEEGELLPDVPEVEEVADVSNMTTGSPELGEILSEVGSTPLGSPARFDEEAANDEKAKGGDAGNADEGTSLSTDGDDQSKMEIPESAIPLKAETDPSRQVGSSTGVDGASKQSGASATETDEVKQSPPAGSGPTYVNLAERARERAMLRQSGAGVPPSQSASVPPSQGASGSVRGRLLRRAGRLAPKGARGGRGQSPGQQGP